MTSVDDTDIDSDGRITDVDVTSEMEASFLEYAYSVIYSRALPDARDGLKPVQRRILYTMHDMGLDHSKPHVKCARVVGQVMGKLHPHGDTAIYDALVRMGQDWSMRLPTIDGHGNFGSLDAGPAAYRYTECRLDSPAQAMLEGIGEDAVDFRPNYDGKELEPAVLPAALPHLLVNGATGIAVGMATNIAPHNLVEVISALKHLLRHPDANTDELMRFIPGPDLPTGGVIVGLDGIRDAYETGKGTFKIRATARFEKVTARRQGIVLTELPYGIGPERVIEQIKTGLQNKKLTGIADVKDLTDLEHGTRLVIEAKAGINPQALLEQLYKHTKLEDTFAINNVALVDGQPRTLSLHEMLTVYLDHRIDVTTRRAQFQLDKANDRLHLVDGLLLALVDIDDVIAIIRSSDDVPEARARLMEAFDLTEIQANYILDLQLRRLTKLSKIELEKEREDLLARIEELTELLGDRDVLHAKIARDLDEVAGLYGTPRRTVLLSEDGITTRSSAPLEIPDDPCWVVLSSAGLITRIDSVAGDDLPSDGPRTSHDVITAAIKTTAHGEYGVITSAGRLVRAQAIELPAAPLTATAPNVQGGTRLKDVIELASDERPICLVPLSEDSPGLILGTRNGVVKRVKPEILTTRDDWTVITLDDGDEVIGGQEIVAEDADLVFITSDAQLLRFDLGAIREQGRSGKGVAGIKVAPGAFVTSFGIAYNEDTALVVTNSGNSTALPGTHAGNIKVSLLADFPRRGRATAGMRCHRFLKGEDTLLVSWAGDAPAVAAASSGSPIDLPSQIRKRDTSGEPAAQPIDSISTRAIGISR